MKKQVFAICGVLVLSACGSDVPSPAERLEQTSETAEAVDPSRVTLRSDGLVAGAEAFYFSAGQTEVETALAGALGKAVDSGEMAECGAGPMGYASYSGGITVNFQDGSLIGWNLREGTEDIDLASGLDIGTPRAEVEAVSGYSAIQDSTLGEEFIISGDVAGFIEEDTVSMLYAGVQCFFR